MDSLLYSTGMDVVSVLFSSIVGLITFPILLLGLALVLYFFTGEKKKADLILPHLMGYSLKVFAYVWMLIISFVALIPAFMVTNYVVSSIVGLGRYNSSEMLLIPLVTLAVLFLLLFAAMKLNRSVIKKSERGADVPSKIVFTIGLVIHSIITFISGLLTLGSILSALFGSAYYRSPVDPGVTSLFIVSLAASIAFYAKAMQIVKREVK